MSRFWTGIGAMVFKSFCAMAEASDFQPGTDYEAIEPPQTEGSATDKV